MHIHVRMRVHARMHRKGLKVLLCSGKGTYAEPLQVWTLTLGPKPSWEAMLRRPEAATTADPLSAFFRAAMTSALASRALAMEGPHLSRCLVSAFLSPTCAGLLSPSSVASFLGRGCHVHPGQSMAEHVLQDTEARERGRELKIEWRSVALMGGFALVQDNKVY